MPDHIKVPVKKIGKELWGELSAFGFAHHICGETVKMTDHNFSFAGGHRVRLYAFKKNVHWKIPEGVSVDISNVVPAGAPPRRAQRT